MDVKFKNNLMTELYSAAILGIQFAKEDITKAQLEENISKLADKLLQDIILFEDQVWVQKEHGNEFIQNN